MVLNYYDNNNLLFLKPQICLVFTFNIIIYQYLNSKQLNQIEPQQFYTYTLKVKKLQFVILKFKIFMVTNIKKKVV